MQSTAFPRYSVLMSVYSKENPEFLKNSVESMLMQSVKPSEFVLVIDGPVGENIQNEINALCQKYDITLCPLKQNVGLGAALNAGLEVCTNDIVARMDSDDIAYPDRMEKQLSLMSSTGADIVSGAVCEFEESTDNITAVKSLPAEHSEIIKYVRKRNPFNHPAVVYKKSVIQPLGGYGDYFLFEDYELFARALANGAVGANVAAPVLYMRAGDAMYKRRGGFSYTKKMFRFYKRLKDLGLCGVSEYITCVLPRAIVAIMPPNLRKFVYKTFLRG